MKINDANIQGLGSQGIAKSPETDQAARARQNKVGDGSSSSSTDKVHLSNLSETLRATESESPERAARLERLSADVQAGRYHVDSAELSKSIINDSIKE